jgi:hypothetical protein
MKKELKEGMGFVCATLDEKKRIWQKLIDSGYDVFHDAHQEPYIHIRRFRDVFASTNAANTITDPLNESDFFDEVHSIDCNGEIDSVNQTQPEWTPQAGEWVEVSTKVDPENYSKRQYLCTIDGKHLCVDAGKSFLETAIYFSWHHIRQIKPETMTLQEVREALGKPNLVIE